MINARIVSVAFVFAVSSVSRAQGAGTAERFTVVGIAATGYIGPFPSENILALGGLVGLEQKLSDGISLRAFASLHRGIPSNNVRICRPDGLDGCLDILFPFWLASSEINAVVRPFPRFPLRLTGGLGYVVAADARENRSGARRHSLPAETGLLLRRGVEIPLGRSSRAPRLQYTHSDFRPEPFSLVRTEAVTILFRP